MKNHGARLEPGMRDQANPDIAIVQGLLTIHGFPCGEEDGYGKVTIAAVRSFQAAKKLKVDGVVGLNTWRSLLLDSGDGEEE